MTFTFKNKGKFIKQTCIPENGKLHKVTVKPLKNNQSFSAMVGYVTKDFGKPHYKVVAKGVSAQVPHSIIIIMIINNYL